MRTATKQGGFTLIESVITLYFVTATLVAVFSLFTSIEATNRVSRNQAIVTSYVQKKIDNYRYKDWATLPASLPTSAGNPENLLSEFTTYVAGTSIKPVSATATFTQYGSVNFAETKKVQIRLRYTDGNTTRTINLTTLITRYGLNRIPKP